MQSSAVLIDSIAESGFAATRGQHWCVSLQSPISKPCCPAGKKLRTSNDDDTVHTRDGCTHLHSMLLRFAPPRISARHCLADTSGLTCEFVAGRPAAAEILNNTRAHLRLRIAASILRRMHVTLLSLSSLSPPSPSLPLAPLMLSIAAWRWRMCETFSVAVERRPDPFPM